MSLSKFYDHEYSAFNKVMRLFRKDHFAALGDLLKDEQRDFFYNDEGKFVERLSVDYKNSLHTRKIQRSNYLQFDDNVLNLASMQGAQKVGNFQTKIQRVKNRLEDREQKPLTDGQIKTLKQEIKRVQLKFVKEADVQDKR